MSARPAVSVVIPCLNEEEAVGAVVDAAWKGIRAGGRSGEVVVVDNGSTDRSAEIAAAHGAKVVQQPKRGYGNAYLAGLDHARGDYVVMADADGTYPVDELARFVERLEDGFDLVVGSRFSGSMHRDAMPWLNRYVGNPILTAMLNVLFGVRVSDAHCGMRALRREALGQLDLHSGGMEFASEMIFKAFRRGLRVTELPIAYYPRVGDSKLNRFSDGWRHVRFMLLYSPSWLFLVPGLALFVVGLLGMLALAAGPIDLLGRSWQIHTMLGFVALTLVGSQIVQLWAFAQMFAATRLGERSALLERLRGKVTLERTLAVGAAVTLTALGLLAWVLVPWALEGFGQLHKEYLTALAFTLVGLGMQILFGAFFIALLTIRTADDATVRGTVVAEGRDPAAEPRLLTVR